MSQTIDNNSNTELTPIEVMEALLAGKVLRAITYNKLTVCLNFNGQIVDEEGLVCEELDFSGWEIAPEA